MAGPARPDWQPQPAHTAKSAARVIIAGWGLISPLGTSAWTTFAQLLAGRTISDRAANLPEDIDAVDLVRALGGVASVRHSATDPAVELAERAAREALFAQSGPLPPCLLGTSKGAMHALTAAMNQVRPSSEQRIARRQKTLEPMPPAGPHLAVTLGPMGYLAKGLSDRLVVSVVQSTVAACASSLIAVHQARTMLIRDSVVHASVNDDPHTTPRRVLVISSEAALLPLFIHSYRRLGVLPPLTPAHFRGRPLDRARNGFTLSELGAAVLLERVDTVKPGQIELVDTAVAADGFDLVRTAPTLPALNRVADRLLGARSIDVLHPHATGTQEHDELEMSVYARAVAASKTMPEVYACKGALGHGLGASGLVSLVLACVCAKARRRPPMPWLTDPIESPFPLTADARPLPERSTHAIFAAGFGGHVAGAVIRGC